MNALPLTTVRRLKKIPQTPSVWEGDRRPLSGIGTNLESNIQENGECIIWVDGSEGFVRAMDVVAPEMGPEAMARTLLRAIENPHNPAQPARPQKIVVRDRELQFFLRGALQNLDIAIDYVPELPLIDELFRSFDIITQPTTNAISPSCEQLLSKVAEELWHDAPWESLTYHDIIAIEINQGDLGNIYACVMGMLGREYGVILYRSLDSMKQFRSALFADDESDKQIEQAFLGQDCWFLNYELEDEELEFEDEDDDFDLNDLDFSEIQPLFGSVHPYEGMRPLKEEEEALEVYLALKALQLFYRSVNVELDQEEIPEITKSYHIRVPLAGFDQQSFAVKVATMPGLASELLAMLESVSEETTEEEVSEASFVLEEDLIPEGSICNLNTLSGETLQELLSRPQTLMKTLPDSYLEKEYSPEKSIPVIIIQTTRPKAKIIIDQIESEGGIQGICLNPGEDNFSGIDYDLAILQTSQGNFYLLAEFIREDADYIRKLEQWKSTSDQTNGYCALIVAMGVTGGSRGNPQPKDMMAIFEAKVIDVQTLGLGVLQLQLDWE